MVLYRKYRPGKFSEIVGQEHIIKTVENALASGKFGHGYLFAGPRGTGKTTLARIFAKALNCTGRKLGKDSYEPCNKCVSCKDISQGKSLDLIEIDAASNRGIDEIRELRDKIRFAPTSSKYKVYIVDEVHMLTKEAFNALLKTLEEPPSHAIFIMATTEPHKVLPTILSRVQRFDFHKATLAELEKLLKKVAKEDEIKIDDEAVILLSQLSFGAFRDGLSILEQVASMRQTAVSKITLENVQEVLGLAQEKSVFEFVKLVSQQDRKKLYELIAKLYYQGIDLENFTQKLIEVLRKIALFKLGENQLFDLTKEQQAEIKLLAEEFAIEELMDFITKFSNAIPKIKAANLPQLPLEMIVFEITNSLRNTKEHESTKEDEKEGREGRSGIPSEMPVEQRFNSHSQARSELKAANRVVREAESERVPRGPMSTGERRIDQNLWQEVIKEARTHNHSLAAMLRDAVIASCDVGVITLAFKFKFHADSSRKNVPKIEKIIEKITGSSYKIECIVDPELAIKKPLDPDEELLNGAKEVFEVEE